LKHQLVIATLSAVLPLVVAAQEQKSDFWKGFEAELGKAAAQALVGVIREAATAPPTQRQEPSEQFTIQVNQHGAVFRSDKDILYLGKDCDALSKNSGKGRWTWGANGVVIYLEKRRVTFASLRSSPTGHGLCSA
jgi:hypothetical protein